jgi:hypothetical protein
MTRRHNGTYHRNDQTTMCHFNDTYHCVVWSFQWYVPLCYLVISMIRTNVLSGHFDQTTQWDVSLKWPDDTMVRIIEMTRWHIGTYHWNDQTTQWYVCVIWSFIWYVPLCRLVISMIRTIVSSGHFNDTYQCVIWSFEMTRWHIGTYHWNDQMTHWYVSLKWPDDTMVRIIEIFQWYVQYRKRHAVIDHSERHNF